jgi:hypothetical protein
LDVDEVAAIAAGATGFCDEAGSIARWWRAGGTDAAAGDEPGETAAVCRAIEEVARAGVVAAVALRAIGRGFGSGILDFSGACAAGAESPSASIKLVARTVDKAVDRMRGAGVKAGTGVLCGESLTLLAVIH